MENNKKVILSLLVSTILFLFIGACVTFYGVYSICVIKIPLKGLEGLNYILVNILGVITLGMFFIFSIPFTFLNLALYIVLKFFYNKKTEKIISKTMNLKALKSRNKLILINIISLVCVALFGSSYYKGNFSLYTYITWIPCLLCLTLCACISYSIKLKVIESNAKKFCCFLNIVASFVGIIGLIITIFFSIFLPFNGFDAVPKIWSIIYTSCILLSTIIVLVVLLSLIKLIKKIKVSKTYLVMLRMFSVISYVLVIIKSLTLIRTFSFIEQQSKQFFFQFIIKAIPFIIIIFVCSLTLSCLKILLQKNDNIN